MRNYLHRLATARCHDNTSNVICLRSIAAAMTTMVCSHATNVPATQQRYSARQLLNSIVKLRNEKFCNEITGHFEEVS